MASFADSKQAQIRMSVKLQFNFQGVDQTPIEISSQAVSVNVVQDEGPHSSSYTGRHDHGNLPTLKQSGPYADLIQTLQDAKKACDGFLSKEISESSVGDIAPQKKPRIDDLED